MDADPTPIAPPASSPRKPVAELLADAGLRPTRQRLALGELLFGQGDDRHVTAERLYEEALATNLSVSLATVYNALHQFTQAGLLREIAVDGARVYFDTNTADHHHFLLEDDGELVRHRRRECVGLRSSPAARGLARRTRRCRRASSPRLSPPYIVSRQQGSERSGRLGPGSRACLSNVAACERK